MKSPIKSTLMVIAGLLWLLFALGFGLLSFQYLTEGAGIQVLGFFGVSSLTVLMGLVLFVGFTAAAGLCFVVGTGLFAHGLVPAPAREKPVEPPPKNRLAFLWRHAAGLSRHKDADTTLRCVCCRSGLDASVHICPECGWTQPHGQDT